jgi:hypothetical protein
MHFTVKETLSEQDVKAGLANFMKDALTTQIMTTLTSGTFLVAFALKLGATNLFVGLLAAIPLLTQLVQLPAIYLIETYRVRRAVYVYAATSSRTLWLVIALLPFLLPIGGAIVLLTIAILLRSALAAISTCSWNSWMHDIVPQEQLGAFFSRRMTIATALNIPLSLGAAVLVDQWSFFAPDSVLLAYSALFFGGFLAGLLGVYFISRISEPRMQPLPAGSLFHQRVLAPYKDPNFRNLVIFLATWSFALNFAAPFFTVYMLTLLNFPLVLIIALLSVNQLSSLAFLRIWGRLTDRFSNKSVLAVTGPLMLFCFLGWTFTTLPGPHLLTLPLLTLINALMGLSTAGVSLASGNIALKLSPKGNGVTYLAANSIMNSLAAGVAPILAGAMADLLIGYEFAWTLSWTSPAGGVAVQILNFGHFDFLFVAAFIIGLYSIHRLSLVKEAGEVEERTVLKAFVTEVRLATRQLAFLDGVRNMFHIPFLSHDREPEADEPGPQQEK